MTRFEQELQASGMIHWPLPLHEERSLEIAEKKVLLRREIVIDTQAWTPVGDCGLSFVGELASITGRHYLPGRPSGKLEEGDCGNYGSFGARWTVPDEDWRQYNRLSVSIRPQGEGVRLISGRLCFENNGETKIPDPYNRDGFHSINLKLGKWNRVQVEMPTLPRDRVTGLSVLFYAGGCEADAALGNRFEAEIGDFALEQVEKPEISLGWKLEAEQIAYCFSGYRPKAPKIAVVLKHNGETFQLRDREGRTVFEGRCCATGLEGLGTLDFSSFEAEGEFQLFLGNLHTDWFAIQPDSWLTSAWKTINFLFCQRCGYPVPGVHQTCHRDLLARHNGRSIVVNGGWHDAGDLSQQLIQTAEVTGSLFELAAQLDDTQLPLQKRLEEEALWGLDYLMKTRFGDGYRATSVGTAMWSQGYIGDEDDITARLTNNAYENYLCAAVEAYCAARLKGDPAYAGRVLECAKADFAFAQERFAKTGFTESPPAYWEHSWMTSESAFSATAATAAALLYRATGDGAYADAAVERMHYVLSCQQTEQAGSAFANGGFFYRSPAKNAIVHFSHQARDQIFAQALCAVLAALPTHADAPAWQTALERHGEYLRRLMDFASPYGMMPAGLYRMEEIEDRESFERQHLEAGKEAYERYGMQLRAGTDVGDGYYLRQFPVWFSFRGNNAVLLSMGKAAALCGRFLKDSRLIDAAERQLAWNIGTNPFRQSMMYGEGQRYAQQYAAMSGEAVGELPVGVQTLEDQDEPYWPQMNNATYKEVWTTPSGRWLSLMAELYAAEKG